VNGLGRDGMIGNRTGEIRSIQVALTERLTSTIFIFARIQKSR
jgi:hypothetical protein